MPKERKCLPNVIEFTLYPNKLSGTFSSCFSSVKRRLEGSVLDEVAVDTDLLVSMAVTAVEVVGGGLQVVVGGNCVTTGGGTVTGGKCADVAGGGSHDDGGAGTHGGTVKPGTKEIGLGTEMRS